MSRPRADRPVRPRPETTRTGPAPQLVTVERIAAAWVVDASVLTLTIPIEHPRWCPQEHPEPLRVSGDDLIVRETQARFAGWLMASGRVEIRMRMELSPRSMAAMWLAGFEERPLDAGEICVVEVFGRSVHPRAISRVRRGVKAVNDPRLIDDFASPRQDLDIAELHTYGVNGMSPSRDSRSTATRCAAARGRPHIRCRS